MARNVVARQDGDSYQASFFWLKACGLAQSYTQVKKVAWEMDGTYGFDDVVVFYEPAITEAGSPVDGDYYQVKFHVDHDRGFTWAALTEPEFIGAKQESLLQRLYKNYQADTAAFGRRRYYIVNTWGIDHRDDLKNLLSNTGGIRLELLFKDGERSKFGKIRKAWKEHLGITDDAVLRAVLAPLRIKHSYDDELRLRENLNNSLQLAGLQPIPGGHMASKYGDLIQKLHKAGKNTFTKEELLEICKAEDLLATTEQIQEDYFVLGVRSFQRGAESLEMEVHTLACFLHCFSSRFVLEEFVGMEYINAELVRVADEAMASKKKVLVHLDTHLSIALLLGYHMDSKYSGVDVTLVHKTVAGKILWRVDADKVQEYDEPLWTVAEQEFAEEGSDIALTISVTHNVQEYAYDCIRTALPEVSKSIDFVINPNPGPTSIKDASQIVAAITQLIGRIRSGLRSMPATGRIHLFLAAPNAFAFYLGQRIKPLGKTTLYEFDFERQRDGGYHPIIKIP
jgi:hypothetical protein